MTTMTFPLAIFNFGPMELLVLAGLGILIFGRKLPEVGKNLGRSIVEFKKGLSGTTEEIKKAVDEGDQPAEKPRISAKTDRPVVRRIAGTTDEP